MVDPGPTRHGWPPRRRTGRRARALTTYSTVWCSFWATALALASGTTLLTSPRPATVLTLVLATLFTAALRQLLHGQSTQVRHDRRASVATAAWALYGGVLAVALSGLIQISAALAALVVLLAVVTSPRTVTWALFLPLWADPFPRPASHGGEDPAADEEARREPDSSVRADLAGLSNAELCLAWQRSHSGLAAASSVALRAAMVTTRQLYLDELERRDPVGLRAWLFSGAQAASSPDRYLLDRRR